jgi:hypothetical protein
MVEHKIPRDITLILKRIIAELLALFPDLELEINRQSGSIEKPHIKYTDQPTQDGDSVYIEVLELAVRMEKNIKEIGQMFVVKEPY